MKNLVSTLINDIRRREEIRLLMPMGYVPGIPMLSVVNDMLVVIVPYLRYKVTGVEDETLAFPIRYTVTYSLPDMAFVDFSDLMFDPRFGDVEFNKSIGMFRHQAIQELDKNAYQALRTDTLSSLDKLADMLLFDSPYSLTDDATLQEQLQTIVEPSLKNYYKTIEPVFFNKYLKD